jgi:hypothetical protein
MCGCMVHRKVAPHCMPTTGMGITCWQHAHLSIALLPDAHCICKYGQCVHGQHKSSCLCKVHDSLHEMMSNSNVVLDELSSHGSLSSVFRAMVLWAIGRGLELHKENNYHARCLHDAARTNCVQATNWSAVNNTQQDRYVFNHCRHFDILSNHAACVQALMHIAHHHPQLAIKSNVYSGCFIAKQLHSFARQQPANSWLWQAQHCSGSTANVPNCIAVHICHVHVFSDARWLSGHSMWWPTSMVFFVVEHSITLWCVMCNK